MKDKRWGLLAGALGMLLLLVAIYLVNLSTGEWPESHPWGAALLLMAAINLFLHGIDPNGLHAHRLDRLIAAMLFAMAVIWGIFTSGTV